MADFFRQVYAVLFCWLALSSQPFSMALNTHVTFTSSGRRSLRSVVANRLATADPMAKIQRAFSEWDIGMNLAAVCKENCAPVFRSAVSQGMTFFKQVKAIKRLSEISESLLDGIESVISSSFERSGMTVPETLRASLNAIQQDGYSSPPLAPIFEEQLDHVWTRFQASEVYKSMESVDPGEAIKAIESVDPSVSSGERVKPDGRSLHELLVRLVSDRIAPLDEMEAFAQVDPLLDAGPSSTPSSPSEYNEDQMSIVTPEPERVEVSSGMVLSHNKQTRQQKEHRELLHQHAQRYSLEASTAEMLLLEVESKHGAALLAILLLHFMNEMVRWFIDHSGPYGLYGFVALLLFAKVIHVLIGASETAVVVPEHDEVGAELEFEAPAPAAAAVEADEEEEEDEDEATKDAPRCSVCWSKPVDVYSPTCRHYALCSECAAKLTHCPICRAPLGAMQSLSWPKYKEIQSLYVNGKEQDVDL